MTGKSAARTSGAHLRRSARISGTDTDYTVLRSGRRAKRTTSVESSLSTERHVPNNRRKASPITMALRRSSPVAAASVAYQQMLKKRPALSPSMSLSNVDRRQQKSPPCSEPPASNFQLILRLNDIEIRAKEIEICAKEIESKLKDIVAREQAMADILIVIERGKAEELLAHLDDSYMCSLCLEIVAHPFVLVPRACGHTFCAGCIIRWFLARLRNCAHWHEELECPICRALHAPVCGYTNALCVDECYPCSHVAYPCVPNRQTYRTLENLTDRLTECVGKLGDAAGEDLAKWAVEGPARQEWMQRTAIGRREAAKFERAWHERHFKKLRRLKRQLGV